MILVIDNYDSFTYNLVQYLGDILKGGDESRIGVKDRLLVFRNDKVNTEHISRLSPQAIIISPGPGRPEDAGISNEVIKTFGGKIPILGVCLGHQCIGYSFGAEIVGAPRLMHGKTSNIHHDGKTIYVGIENPFVATRYHSLIIEKATLPDCFEITARTDQDEVMGIRHNDYILEGVQFHPESILTKAGKDILRNFLKVAKGELNDKD